MSEGADDNIAAARAAWARLRNERQTFADWVLIGRALAIGRAVCMRQANANKPAGSRYNRLMGQWLRENGLDGINNQERYRAILVLENLAAIERWRDGLDEGARRRLNHPAAIWAHWQRTMRPRRTIEAPRPLVGKLVKPPRPTGDMLRRICAAMHETRSNDRIILAEAAYYAVRMADAEAAAPTVPQPKTAKRPRAARLEANPAAHLVPA
jgi:hypothetical protein